MKDPRLVPLLLRLLKNEEPVVVQCALISLRKQDEVETAIQVLPLLRYSHGPPRDSHPERDWGRRNHLLRKDSVSLLSDTYARFRRVLIN